MKLDMEVECPFVCPTSRIPLRWGVVEGSSHSLLEGHSRHQHLLVLPDLPMSAHHASLNPPAATLSLH